MKSVLKPVRSPLPSDPIDGMLSRYYQRLVEWSRILARGDETAAEECVQDLCLHLTLARPDMSHINNLDNYLFMCLRNMYVSNLERVSRERLRVIQVEDYDAVGMATAIGGLDTVEVQNQLLRITDYVMSRKYSSKSASHFILHFLLGYRRSDVALLARTPIAAIYNGLKEVRAELRSYLSADKKIGLVSRNAVPRRELLRTAIASDILLKELRSNVFDADPADCSLEGELVNAYRRPGASPVGCQELAHLAGCERCQKILERTLQMDDHDGPLDGLDGDHMPKQTESKSFDTTMQLVRRRREQLLERRPALLAIAVDGRVVAFHAVESAHNSLSSRVSTASTVRFIEVFDEYGDRLAHIPLETLSPVVLREQLSQRLLLSDDRRLQLEVRFDGLGIHAEVDYVDPALASSGELEESPHTPRDPASFWARFRRPGRFRLTPWSTLAFASIVLAVVSGIVIGYRFMHPGWRDVVARAQAAAQVPSATEAFHQTLRLEETMGPDKDSILGSVDVWQSSDRNMVRRLYNAHQQLLATSISSANGATSIRLEEDAEVTPADRRIVESSVWLSDVSTAVFADRQTTAVAARRSISGFEVTQQEDGRNGILARTLELDRAYHVQAERVRFRTGEGVFEVRLIQTLLRKVPSRDVPASAFPKADAMPSPGAQGQRPFPAGLVPHASEDPSGANLEVAVLFALFQQEADTGQPIDLNPVSGGRVRMTGTVANAQLLASIRQRVTTLPNADRVDFQIHSAAEAASTSHRGKASAQELVASSGEAPAAGLIRDALLARGLKGATLQDAEQEFRTSALSHAQAALQHAYALDRLGAILQRAGQSSLDSDARVKWARMVEKHGGVALAELEALRLQLDSLSPGLANVPSPDARGITDATAFAHATSVLRARAQSVNEEAVKLFAGSAAELPGEQAHASITALQEALPIAEASSMRSFASRLTNRESTAQNQPGEIRLR